jgi:hypothetical protein
MPVTSLTETPVLCNESDIAGCCNGAFVYHVALLSQDIAELCLGQTIAATHVVPPIQVGTSLDDVHLLGIAKNLSDDDQLVLRSFADQLSTERDADLRRFLNQEERRLGRVRRDWTNSEKEEFKTQYMLRHYVAIPHLRNLQSPDGTVITTRLSCAGFVLEAYRRLEIRLVDTSNLPQITLADLVSHYGDDYLNDEGTRAAMGLTGDGPWPVLLPSHIVHSCNRELDDAKDSFVPTDIHRTWTWPKSVTKTKKKPKSPKKGT